MSTDPTKIEPELLPCPFCGGPARLEPWCSDDNSHTVKCRGDCRIFAPSSRIENTAEEAIAAWNHRPITPAPEPSEVARLRAELENAKAALGEHPDTEVDLAQRISELRDLTAELDALKEQLDPLAYDTEVRRLILRAEKAEAELDAVRKELEQTRAVRDSNKMSVQIIQKNRDEWERSWGQVVRERDAAIARAESAERELNQVRDSRSRVIVEQDTQLAAAKEALRAAGRIVADKYIAWHDAGGVNDCAHGYGEGIPCRKCDVETIQRALTPDSAGTKEETISNETVGIIPTAKDTSGDIPASSALGVEAASRLPFDILKALAGHPVVTRDGREVKNLHKTNEGKLRGIVGGFVLKWDITGRTTERTAHRDLFLAPCPPDHCPDCWGTGKRTLVEPAAPGRGRYNFCQLHAEQNSD